jgi:hypothetical protein
MAEHAVSGRGTQRSRKRQQLLAKKRQSKRRHLLAISDLSVRSSVPINVMMHGLRFAPTSWCCMGMALSLPALISLAFCCHPFIPWHTINSHRNLRLFGTKWILVSSLCLLTRRVRPVEKVIIMMVSIWEAINVVSMVWHRGNHFIF